MAAVRYDDSWMRKVTYGGPPIDWDRAWNYFEGKRQEAREAERRRKDAGARLFARINSPQWASQPACQSERTSI